ncbi:MAG: arginine N-succinyltransferase [Caulobacteraceae bacterium]|nr:arginine N-succinyltransferase [Caulobacteraceae bacterium]
MARRARLLEWEGFTFSNVVDIFDGGPLMSRPRDQIRTFARVQAPLQSRTSRAAYKCKAGLGRRPGTSAKPYRCVFRRAVCRERRGAGGCGQSWRR